MKKLCLLLLIGYSSSFLLSASNSFAASQDDNQQPQLSSDDQVSHRIDKTLGDHIAYKTLISNLKEAVTVDNRQNVADLMSYPLDVELDGNQATIDGVTMFLAFYDMIMTPEIVLAIQNTAYADVFVSYEGVMLGDGQVWVNGICKNEACSDVEVLVSTLQKGPN